MKRWLQLIVAIVLAIAGYNVADFDLDSGTGSDAGSAAVERASERRAERSSGVEDARRRSGIAINEAHIFTGEINRRGKPVGYHARPGGVDPRHARVERVRSGPNRLGVYQATVAIYDADDGRWLEKRSSFFPDALSRAEVLSAIRHAWDRREGGEGDRWRGPSGLGFTIEGYTHRGRINTAYPIYR